jgi:crotonobetainyl-CoA:carnitine CoA-transferase CaiB-like acyl-CoA transferase
MTSDEFRSGPLDGVLVVDLSRALAGPYASQMLGDLGARVIKVESPNGGDESRSWGPPFAGPDGISTYFLSCNRNKESVTADLKTAEGRLLLSRLIARADVLVENFRPGVLDRLGFAAEFIRELNPEIVICSLTGFGHDGPESQRAGYDQILQGEAGLMSLTGPEPTVPTKVGVPIADLLAGMNAAFGIAAALRERHATGKARTVRTSLLAGLVGVHAFQGTRWTVAKDLPVAEGNVHPSIAPYGLFQARDGALQIACGNDVSFARLMAALGLEPDDERFGTNERRVAHRGELTEQLNRALGAEPVAIWIDRLTRTGVAAGRVRDLAEVYDWEQTRSQGLVITVEHPTLGAIELPGPVLRFDDRLTAGGRSSHLHPPLLGEHNAEIRRWLELSETEEAIGER